MQMALKFIQPVTIPNLFPFEVVQKHQSANFVLQENSRNFLNFINILENLTKSYIGAPQRVGAPSYGES